MKSKFCGGKVSFAVAEAGHRTVFRNEDAVFINQDAVPINQEVRRQVLIRFATPNVTKYQGD